MTTASWPTIKLGEHIELLTGFPFKSALYSEVPTDMRLVRGDNVIQGTLRWDGVKRWDASKIGQFAQYNLELGDVVVAMDRPWIEAGLKWAYIKDRDLPCLLVQRVARLRGKKDLLTKFLRYVIADHCFEGYIKGVLTGVNVPHVSGPQIQSFQFRLPPPEVQEKIAGVLSAYDDLIENNTRRIKILEEMAQMLYREWFVKFRFPGHERVKMKNGVPEGWKTSNLFDIAEVTYGFPFKSALFSAEPIGTPVVRNRNIPGNATETYTPEVVNDKYLVRNGDILVGMDGEFHMGKWAGGMAYLNQRNVRFRPNPGYSAYWLFLTLQKPIQHFEATIGCCCMNIGPKRIHPCAGDFSPGSGRHRVALGHAQVRHHIQRPAAKPDLAGLRIETTIA